MHPAAGAGATAVPNACACGVPLPLGRAPPLAGAARSEDGYNFIQPPWAVVTDSDGLPTIVT